LIKNIEKNRMPVCEIAGSTPGGIHQINLIADLTEEEYLEFAGMCS
jgi:hypothetical protein